MAGDIITDRKHRNRNGRKVGAFQRKNKMLREEIARLRDVVDKRERKVFEEERAEIARLSARLLDSEARLRDVRARAPGLIEVCDVQHRWFLSRLWWALGFARTGRLRYERQ